MTFFALRKRSSGGLVMTRSDKSFYRLLDIIAVLAATVGLLCTGAFFWILFHLLRNSR